jgi:DNA polymerase III delta prime subunit
MEKITLNEDQKLVLEKLKDFIESDKQHMHLMEGAAGTGKTTTISKFIEWLLEETNIEKIAMASPTHKALKVMTEMCLDKHKASIVFSTLHSMLGLKHEITKDGKEIFVRDKNVMTKFPFYELVIIDESSMIADQLFNEMEDQNYRKIKVLFVGDSNQINPVNHKMSIPMLEEKRKEYNIGHCRLDKIVRQAEGNPIIAYSQKIINSTFSFAPGEKEMVGDSGVVMLSESQNKILQQLLQYYFGSSKFDEDANYCKVIAWRNTTVDFYNKIVRNFKYGAKAGKIVLDEKLIADRPIKNDDYKVSFSTNEDLVVKNIEIKEKKLFDNDSWVYYDCLVQGMDKTDNIHILHEKEEKRYNDTLRKLSKEAVDEKEISSRLKKWRKYYSFMENFAQVKYNYAITCHNSQGSTYENCFVIQSDIDMNRNEEEKRRILYTAFTRPRKMLYIL